MSFELPPCSTYFAENSTRLSGCLRITSLVYALRISARSAGMTICSAGRVVAGMVEVHLHAKPSCRHITLRSVTLIDIALTTAVDGLQVHASLLLSLVR